MVKIIVSTAFIAVIAILFAAVVSFVIAIALLLYAVYAIGLFLYQQITNCFVKNNGRVEMKSWMLTAEEYYNSKA